MSILLDLLEDTNPDSVTLHFRNMEQNKTVMNTLAQVGVTVSSTQPMFFTDTKAITIREFASGFNVTISNKE